MLEIAIIFGLTLILCKLVTDYMFRKQLPPGPIGLPFLGYLPLLKGEIHLTLKKLANKYGNIMSIRIGPDLFVVANDYKSMKDLVCPPEALDRSTHLFGSIEELGFTATNGMEWEEQRRFCMQSMRDLGLGKGLWQTMIYDDIPSFLNELSSYAGKPIDIRTMLARKVNGNILSLLIGRRLEEGKEDHKIKIATDFSAAVMTYIDPSTIFSMIPLLKTFCQYFKIGGYDKHWRNIQQFVNEIVKTEIKEHKKEKFEANNTDFIGLYLEKMKAEDKKGTKHFFSDVNAAGNINSLYLGASDTILASLGWLFGLMAKYPEIQVKVQAELDDVIGRDGKIFYEDRFNIPYTFSVLMESQRYSNIVPIPAPRQANATFQVRSFTIPKGTKLLFNLWAIHRDPNYFKDPEEFKPERFLTADGKKFIANPVGFVPFSTGKRNCPGETVAWMEILIFFTSVMQKITIKPPADNVVELESMPGIIRSLKPQEFCFIERTT